MKFQSVCLLEDKVKNQYVNSFEIEPHTIQDTASNILKFYDETQVNKKKKYWNFYSFILDSLTCQELICSYRKSKEIKSSYFSVEDLYNLALKYSPDEYKNRKRLGVGNIQIKTLKSGTYRNFTKREHYQDNEGNPALLSFYIFLNSNEKEVSRHHPYSFMSDSELSFNVNTNTNTNDNDNNKPLNLTKILVPMVEGHGICMDHKYSIMDQKIIKGIQYILKIDIVYDLLPSRLYDSCTKEEIAIVRRGLMQSCFINKKESHCYTYFNRTLKYEQILNPELEPCGNCGEFIHIENKCCPSCLDQITPIPGIHSARSHKKWISVIY